MNADRRIGRPARPASEIAIDSAPASEIAALIVVHVRSGRGWAIHATARLPALLEILICASCPEGGPVGDRFAGSSVAGDACRHAGRLNLGCEIDAAMAQRARARVAAVPSFAEGARR